MTIAWESAVRLALRIEPAPQRPPPAAWMEAIRHVLADRDEPVAATAAFDVVAAVAQEPQSPTALGSDVSAQGARDADASPLIGLAPRIATGDLVAFRLAFDTYFDRLYRYIYTYTRSWDVAEDLVHDVFLHVWTQPAKLADVRRLDAYLYTVARRDALDYLKHRSVEARSAAELSGLAPVPTLPHEREFDVDDTMAALQRAIDSLPSRQREVILLRLQQVSYENIAARLGISRGAVAAHWHKAIKQLRQLLK